MKKYSNVDVIRSLRRIMESNTEHYMEDFDVDVRMLEEAGRRGEVRPFLWMSRKCGTYCFLEKDVFLQHSQANNTWRYYAETDPKQKILAYAVKLHGFVNGILLGDLYELDYRPHAACVAKHTVPSNTLRIHYENGDVDQPFGGFIDISPSDTLGPYHSIEFLPDDKILLGSVLEAEEEGRRKAKEAKFPFAE